MVLRQKMYNTVVVQARSVKRMTLNSTLRGTVGFPVVDGRVQASPNGPFQSFHAPARDYGNVENH